MNALKLVIASLFLFSASNLMADKAPKVLVCHVGGEGTIDLIVVSANSNHLGNDSHSFDSLTDYEPSVIGASGEGTDDVDGDGIDEGCEPPMLQACPCWEEDELTAVNKENHDFDFSCAELGSSLSRARVQNVPGSTPDVEGSFEAWNTTQKTSCQTRDLAPFNVGLYITKDEAASCIEQIATRCAALGSPFN